MALHDLDLQYLTNPAEMAKIVSRKAGINEAKNTDFKFYEKRILHQTKAFLTGTEVPTSVEAAFAIYIQRLVEHFKFVDKAEAIQKDYDFLSVPKSKKVDCPSSFDIATSNKVIMKMNNLRPPRITDHIKIKQKGKNIVLPKIRNFDPNIKQGKGTGVA